MATARKRPLISSDDMIKSENESESESESTRLLPRESHAEGRRVSVLRAQIVIVIVHVLMSSISVTYCIVLTQYLVDRLAREHGNVNITFIDPCDSTSNASDPSNEVQKKVANFMTNFNFLQTIPAIVACFLVGSWSDYIGRRLLLLLPLFSQFCIVAVITLVIKFNLDVNLIYIGFALDGLAGSWPAIYVIEFAITADINASKDSRTTWMYIIICSGSIVLAGVMLATSFLIDAVGFFYASLLLTAMGLLNFLVPLFFLPETLVQKPTNRVWNPLFHCQRLFGLYISEGTRRRRATRTLCLLIFLFAVACQMVISNIDSLYQLHEPFCWGALRIGEYNSIRNFAGNIVGAVWLAGLRKFLPPEVIAMVGVAFQATAFGFEAFIKKSWQFYIVPALLVPNTCVVPIIRSMMSLLVVSNQQGALFSSVAVVETIWSFATVTAFNQLYGATVSTFPGAVYLLMSGCAIVAFILFGIYFTIREKPESIHESVTNQEEDVPPPHAINI